MRSSLALIWCLLLASAVMAAPTLTAATSVGPALNVAADHCCGCCPEATTADLHSCCAASGGESDASADPCEDHCEHCPCCAAVSPGIVAILDQPAASAARCLTARLILASDLLTSRSDKPLLPPPRG